MATNLHFVPARTKGKENPVLNGFRYFLDRTRDDKSYWKCCCYKTHSCKARIITVDKQLTSPVPDHSHDVQHAEIAVHVAKQNLKRKAAESNLPTRFLASQVSCGLSQESRAKIGCHVSSLSRMARLARQQSDRAPANPTSLEDLILPPSYITSNSGESLLLWDSGYTPQHRRSILLGTPHNMSSMGDAEHLVMDGTFKSSPNLFYQLFTVHGLFPDGWHYPLCYGLLPGKTTTLYTNIFTEIDSYGPFQPQSIQCDYELAIHNAVAEVWPASTLRGCYFHHKKSLFLKLQQHDLSTEYAVPDSEIRNAFKMIGAIAFVPECDVPRVWRHLKPLLPPDMVTFASYYESTWVGTSSSNPHFSHSIWNFYDSTLMLLPRSTNIAEGWHHGFNSMLSCHNPTLWKFLDCLKSEQDLTDLKMARRLMQEPPEPRAPKWVRYEGKLQKILEKYDTYSDTMDYLKAVGNML